MREAGLKTSSSTLKRVQTSNRFKALPVDVPSLEEISDGTFASNLDHDSTSNSGPESTFKSASESTSESTSESATESEHSADSRDSSAVLEVRNLPGPTTTYHWLLIDSFFSGQLT